MANQYVFKRREVKYLLTREKAAQLCELLGQRLRPDEHGRSTLRNVYFDTPDYLLIRRSLEHPLYKEKLRVRSYGPAAPDTPAFVELKKKYRKTVYKRRVCAPTCDAMAFLSTGAPLPDSQIVREIDFARRRYAPLRAAMFLSYERQAFFSVDDREFRITFDDAILWRTEDATLEAGPGGEALLPPGHVLMEVKAGGAYPLWAAEALSALELFPTSFSKYGRAYAALCLREGWPVSVPPAPLPSSARVQAGAA